MLSKDKTEKIIETTERVHDHVLDHVLGFDAKDHSNARRVRSQISGELSGDPPLDLFSADASPLHFTDL